MRCQLALFSAYRIDQYADPEGFKVSLGAVLEGFPDEVIRFVCDPRTGLQRRMKWPPTISEVVEACEEHQQYLQKVRTQRPIGQRLPKPYEKPTYRPGKIFIAPTHPQYASVAGHGEAHTASDGRQGMLVAAETLMDLGIMKRGIL